MFVRTSILAITCALLFASYAYGEAKEDLGKLLCGVIEREAGFTTEQKALACAAVLEEVARSVDASDDKVYSMPMAFQGVLPEVWDGGSVKHVKTDSFLSRLPNMRRLLANALAVPSLSKEERALIEKQLLQLRAATASFVEEKYADTPGAVKLALIAAVHKSLAAKSNGLGNYFDINYLYPGEKVLSVEALDDKLLNFWTLKNVGTRYGPTRRLLDRVGNDPASVESMNETFVNMESQRLTAAAMNVISEWFRMPPEAIQHVQQPTTEMRRAATQPLNPPEQDIQPAPDRESVIQELLDGSGVTVQQGRIQPTTQGQ